MVWHFWSTNTNAPDEDTRIIGTALFNSVDLLFFDHHTSSLWLWWRCLASNTTIASVLVPSKSKHPSKMKPIKTASSEQKNNKNNCRKMSVGITLEAAQQPTTVAGAHQEICAVCFAAFIIICLVKGTRSRSRNNFETAEDPTPRQVSAWVACFLPLSDKAKFLTPFCGNERRRWTWVYGVGVASATCFIGQLLANHCKSTCSCIHSMLKILPLKWCDWIRRLEHEV